MEHENCDMTSEHVLPAWMQQLTLEVIRVLILVIDLCLLNIKLSVVTSVGWLLCES